MKWIFVCGCVAGVLPGCGEAMMDYDISAEMPVVESYLQEGASSLTVKVYSMEAYLKDGYRLSKPVGGLEIDVNGQSLTETSSGTYSLDLGEDTIRENQRYDMQFAYSGKSVEGSATVPAPVCGLRVVPDSLVQSSSWYFMDSSDTAEVTVSWDDVDNSYYQVYIESPNTTDMPSLGIFGSRMMQPFRGNSYRATARDFRSPGTHRIHVYRVGRDYAELYGRVSSSDLSNPVSFIRNAFGIFTSLSVAKANVRVYEGEE